MSTLSRIFRVTRRAASELSLPVLLLGVALGVLFLAYPQLDLIANGQFYDPLRGGFYLRDHPLSRFIYEGTKWLVKGAVVFFVIAGIWSWIARKSIAYITPLIASYLLLSLALGPGLMVNTVFKDHWGRARPSQVEEFGGTQHFTPPLIITDQCEKNCSFVSGHASVGFWFLAPALLLTGRKRRFAVTASVAAGLGIGLVRMIQGGHFLSDVLFSGLVVYIVTTLLHAVMISRRLKRE